jgi:hypothetical protein
MLADAICYSSSIYNCMATYPKWGQNRQIVKEPDAKTTNSNGMDSDWSQEQLQLIQPKQLASILPRPGVEIGYCKGFRRFKHEKHPIFRPKYRFLWPAEHAD